MHTDKFALGMRLPLVNGEPPKGCIDSMLRGVSQKNIRGLTMYAGIADGMYDIVIMGGGLSQMRKLYADIAACKSFTALLAPELAYIGNNRISRLPELPPIPLDTAK